MASRSVETYIMTWVTIQPDGDLRRRHGCQRLEGEEGLDEEREERKSAKSLDEIMIMRRIEE